MPIDIIKDYRKTISQQLLYQISLICLKLISVSLSSITAMSPYWVVTRSAL